MQMFPHGRYFFHLAAVFLHVARQAPGMMARDCPRWQQLQDEARWLAIEGQGLQANHGLRMAIRMPIAPYWMRETSLIDSQPGVCGRCQPTSVGTPPGAWQKKRMPRGPLTMAPQSAVLSALIRRCMASTSAICGNKKVHHGFPG